MNRAVAFAVCAALLGCRSTNMAERRPWPRVTLAAAPNANLTNACPAGHNPAFDYFPDKVTVEHARQFSVSYHGHYKRLTFRPSVKHEQPEEFLLVQCGTPVPAHDSRTRVVTVPAQRFVLTNLAFISAAVRMGLLDQLIGISSINGVSHPAVLERHSAGRLKEVGTGPHSSVELAMAVDTEILFTFYSAWPNYNTHPKLWEVGIQGIPTADHFESTTLGRTEWIKFLALFFNREREANEIFAPVARRYQELQSRVRNPATRPDVLVGWPSGRDIWNLNGSRNFFASLIHDAGGEYFWQDDLALSLVPVNMERAFDQQRDSLFYISRSYSASTRAALAGKNPVMPHLRAFSQNQIWSPDKNTQLHRKTPWQDQSLDHPDVVLADLIFVLHPERMPNYEPYYFRRLD